MQILAPQFQTALESETTTIAWCWLISRRDGVQIGATSFDLGLTIAGIDYEPITGFDPTADSNSEGLENNNAQDLSGLLTSEQISAQDLLSGKFDGAVITCFLVDVLNLPISLDQNPPSYLQQYQRTIKRSIQGELAFRFELRDDDWLLETEISKATSKFCSYDLGSPGCGVDLAPYTFQTVVASVVNRYTFNCNGADFVPTQFDRGLITFLSGANAGVTRDIKSFGESNFITLWQPLPKPVSTNDQIQIVQGCGKTIFDCVTRYNNAINSDSEPHIPTQDQAISTPTENG